MEMGTQSPDPTECESYRPMREYSHLHEIVDNAPYLLMGLLGGAILVAAWGATAWAWLAGAAFFTYSIGGAVWFMRFICPYCLYHGTRSCPCGYGQIAAKFWAKESENRFAEKFRKHIPVIAPLWVAPVACGGWSLWSNYSVGMLALLVAFALDAFIVLPLVSRIYGCAHCPQKEDCPWMGGKAKEA